MEDVIPSVEFEPNEEAPKPGVGYQHKEYVPITEWDSSNAAGLTNW